MVTPNLQQSVMLIDQSKTGAGDAIARQIELDRQRAVLSALADYADDNDLTPLAGKAAWGKRLDWYPDATVAQFIAEGGAGPALRAIRAKSAKLADGFEMPRPALAIVPTPPDIARLPMDRLDAALTQYLRPPRDSGRKAIDNVLAIPADFGASPKVDLWTNGQPRGSFMPLNPDRTDAQAAQRLSGGRRASPRRSRRSPTGSNRRSRSTGRRKWAGARRCSSSRSCRWR